MVGDTQRGQSEARGGNAGHAPGIAPARQVVARAVENLSRVCAPLFPEEQAALPLQIIQKRFIFQRGFPGVAGDRARNW